MRTVNAVWLVAALVCAPAPAFGDEFCDAVTTIVNDAANEFEAIRGEASDRDRFAYDAPLVVIPDAVVPYPGSPPCRARNTVTTVGWVYMYSCSFMDSHRADEQAHSRRTLTDRIGACVGVDMTTARVSMAEPASYQLENARIQIVPHNHPDGGWARITVYFSPPTWGVGQAARRTSDGQTLPQTN